MGGIWALGELVDGRPTRLTLELATLAVDLAVAAGAQATGRLLLAGAQADAAASEAAGFGSDVLMLGSGTEGEADADVLTLAARLAGLLEAEDPSLVLIGATQWGRDVAGTLVGLTDRPILVNASRVSWGGEGPEVETSAFGGRLITRSVFTEGGGIVLVRPGSVAARPAEAPGRIESATVSGDPPAPRSRVVERVAQPAGGQSVEEARRIVGAGRGVAGAEGLVLLAELASELGAAVGATRAVVDAGWLPYADQIGQTGKLVRPDLYLACGVSGAIQHKVGVQTAGTIVSINRDPDAPIGDFADLAAVGDLFEVVPRLTRLLRSRRGSA